MDSLQIGLIKYFFDFTSDSLFLFYLIQQDTSTVYEIHVRKLKTQTWYDAFSVFFFL